MMRNGKFVNLPVVDVLARPYRTWTKRDPTEAEQKEAYERTGKFLLHVNDHLIATVTTYFEAATYIASGGPDTGLASHINSSLDGDTGFSEWRKAMPSATPTQLEKYRNIYPHCDFVKVNSEINAVGAVLSPGQQLFHGGVWPVYSQEFVTERPLSTTFCPIVAVSNAAHKGKAYDDNRIDLLVLRVVEPATKVFVYKRKGTRLGHENEVVFATGARLRLRNRVQVPNSYVVGKAHCPDKWVPIYVLEVDIS